MFTLNFRELWAPLSQWLADEMDQLAASAQAKWFQQHDAAGGHGDVTAASVTTRAFTVTPYVYDVPEVTNTSSTTPGITLVLPGKTSLLVLKTPMPTVGPRWFGIHSIQMPDARAGDVLHVVRNTTTPILIDSVGYPASGAPAGVPEFPMGNRIRLDQSRLTNFSTDTVTYFDHLDTNAYGVTLVRVDAMDYETFASGNRFSCWVQIG